MSKRLPYNARKRFILSVLEQAYPNALRAENIAWKAGISPKRSVYWRLNRLYRFGLLRRWRDSQRRFVYRISLRGRSRLLWLLRKNEFVI